MSNNGALDRGHLAASTGQVLHYAILQHRHQHQGRLPKRFVLPPAVYLVLQREPCMLHQIHPVPYGSFEGVPIGIEASANYPMMITATNDVEYV